MDWIEIIMGAAVFLAGMGVGTRIKRTPQPPEPLKPMCSCGHGYGSHEDGRPCRAETYRETRWDSFAGHMRAVQWQAVPCPCLRYDGPSPSVLGIEP